MSSAYDPIKLLSQLDATKPSNAEEARALASAERQLRAFLVYFLAKFVNDDGTLKDGVVSSSDILGDGVITGSSANVGGAQGEIQQGTVSTPDLRDAAVSALKIATDAVESAKIKALAVTAAKLAADAVETDKIKDLAVTVGKLAGGITAAKLATDAVETAKIKDLAVTGGKLAQGSVDPTKISNIGLAKILVGDGSNAQAGTVGGVLSATWDNTAKELVFAFGAPSATGNIQYAVVTETYATTAEPGASVAGVWTPRPTWTDTYDPRGLVSVSATKIILNTGTYLIHAQVPAYSVGKHRIKLRKTTATAADIVFGSGAEAPPGTQNMATLEGVVQVTADNTEFEIQHWCELTHAKGFGRATGDGSSEIYGRVEILKV